MLTFEYRARSGPGQEVQGRLEAESRLAALDKLSAQGYFPLSLQEDADPSTHRRWRLLDSVPRKDLCLWTRQLADLLESEVPLVKALGLVQEQTDNPHLARLIRNILENVRGGKPFSEALKDHPRVFPPLYISLIYAGEVGGTLSVTLARLANFLEEDQDFKSRVQAALAYPILIAAVGIGTVFFLMVFAVPRLAAMFTDLGQGMPFITRVLTRASEGLTSYGGQALLALTLGGILAWRKGAGPLFKKFWGRTLVRIPFWGPVAKKSVIARFARTLATLLSGGVPIVEALRVVSQVLEEPVLQDQILGVARQVEEGRSLAVSLQEVPDFPVFIRHMISVGEEVNTLEKSLHKVAAAYERETDRAMKLATSLLEPCMILLIGSIVGVIVVAMLLPVFQISAFVK